MCEPCSYPCATDSCPQICSPSMCNPCPEMNCSYEPCPSMCPPSYSCDPCDPCAQYCSPCYLPLKRCKSRELRGSILMTQCDCVKRNGLQLDCPKKECQGRPCCSTKPFPMCCPSKFHWRLANKTMGKKSNPGNVKCKADDKGCGCNPCAVKCYPC